MEHKGERRQREKERREEREREHTQERQGERYDGGEIRKRQGEGAVKENFLPCLRKKGRERRLTLL